jgi:hypothetical protein
MDWKKLGESAIREGLKIMTSPRVAKVMQDPRFQRMVTGALELRAQASAAAEAGVKQLAKRFQLATREEVGALQAEVRSLEAELHEVRGRGPREGKSKRG